MSVGKLSFVTGVVLCAAMVAVLLAMGVSGPVAAFVAPLVVIVAAYVSEFAG
jgi:hypothetical protein